MNISFSFENDMCLKFHFNDYMLKSGNKLCFNAFCKNGKDYHVMRDQDSDDGEWSYRTPLFKLQKDESNDRWFIDTSDIKNFTYVEWINGSYVQKTEDPVHTWLAMVPGRVYFDTYDRMSLKEFVSRLHDDDNPVFDEDFAKAVIKEGVHNVRIMAPCMRHCFCLGIGYSTNDDNPMAECRIREPWNREMYGLYKIMLEPVNDEMDGISICGRDYYAMDFISLLKQGSMKIVNSIGDQSWDHTREYFHSHGINM